MVKTYDILVIGFGKAGKTLAAKMSQLGKKVALVEQDSKMYGGTCINIGCIPTKTMIVAAEENLGFAETMAQKDVVTTRLRQKNYDTVAGAGVDIYNAKARFVSNKVVEITAGSDVEQLTAETIVINTGAQSNVLPIPGLLETKNVVDSTGIQNLDKQPASLGIIGGGNIGLEFASLYSKLGTKVTVFEAGDKILPREEPVVAQLARDYLEEDGITFKVNARVAGVKNAGEQVVLSAEDGDYTFDVVLYAVGDVNGGLQFTYTSLDDFRIVFGRLTGNGDYSLSKRQNVPNTTFIEPALSSVGLKEAELKAKGIAYKTNELRVAAMPRAHVNNDLRGIYKVNVSPETNEILGATLFGQGSQEIINLIKMAMDNHIPYTYIKNQVFTHPTMAENLNDVFNF